jgi:ferredoxin
MSWRYLYSSLPSEPVHYNRLRFRRKPLPGSIDRRGGGAIVPAIATHRRISMAYTISDECIACGACLPECPVEAISEGDRYSIDPAACIDCGACAAVCPVEAIKAP